MCNTSNFFAITFKKSVGAPRKRKNISALNLKVLPFFEKVATSSEKLLAFFEKVASKSQTLETFLETPGTFLKKAGSSNEKPAALTPNTRTFLGSTGGQSDRLELKSEKRATYSDQVVGVTATREALRAKR
jgi:hypothetical protein